jgi:hypothetical protein
MFGDNQAVVTNSKIPHSSLNKRHNALSFHRFREMIAAKILGYYWIDGKKNPADVVSKHWGHQQVWHLLKPLLLFFGDTENILDDGEQGLPIPYLSMVLWAVYSHSTFRVQSTLHSILPQYVK